MDADCRLQTGGLSKYGMSSENVFSDPLENYIYNVKDSWHLRKERIFPCLLLKGQERAI